MNDESNNSEKLLRTNLMELLGGKGMEITDDLLKQEIIVPPTLPPIINKNGNNGNDGRMPELRSSEVYSTN